LPEECREEQGEDDHEVEQGRAVVEVVHRVPVGEHPAQELEREEGAEHQVDRAYPGCVGYEGGGEEVGDCGEVEGEEGRLERNRGRTMAVEQAPQLRAEPSRGGRQCQHRQCPPAVRHS
jgi:hypothetical protein